MFVAPPLSWLNIKEETTEEEILSLCGEEIEISMTLNRVEWMSVGKLVYINVIIERI